MGIFFIDFFGDVCVRVRVYACGACRVFIVVLFLSKRNYWKYFNCFLMGM